MYVPYNWLEFHNAIVYGSNIHTNCKTKCFL